MTAAELKKVLPLPKLMSCCGDGDRAKKSARCPFHEDGRNSFSVWSHDGLWFWKCHAGCGEGDEIHYLQRKFGLDTVGAFAKWEELAGINGDGTVIYTAKPASPDAKHERDLSEQWRQCVASATDLSWLEQERRLSAEFCEWLRQKGLLGVYEGRIALPVHNEAGVVVGFHVRIPPKTPRDNAAWFYYPIGCKVRPLVIGDPKSADTVLVFESQWDAFAVLDKLAWHKAALPGVAVIVTRGCGNGRLVAGLCKATATLYAFVQFDNGSDKWLDAVTASAGCAVKAVYPGGRPDGREKWDFNDWTKAGATGNDVNAAIESAAEFKPAMSAADVAQFHDDSTDDPPLQPFPVECLPGVAGDMARAISECERVPLALSGPCVLGILSASVGAGLSVRSGPQRTTSGNLFILASAESGTGKGPAFRHTVRPFHEYERELIEKWLSTTLPKLQAEQDTLEAEYKNAQKEIVKEKDSALREEIRDRMEKNRARMLELEREMLAPVLSCEDITTERLASLLSQRGEVLASLSPDAGNVVNNLLGRYNKLDRTDESVYLKSYSGDYCRVDRQTRPPVVLYHPCLAVLWLTQPDKLVTLLGERSLADGGFIPRLLICHTNCKPEEIPEHPPVFPANLAEGYGKLIRALLTAFRLSGQQHILEPDAEAAELLREHHNRLVGRRKGDLKDVTSYAARWTEQAWRIAVVLHAALHGEKAHEHTLSVETVRDAIKIADWFAVQQLEILSGGRMKARRDKRIEVLLLLAEYPDGITARLVQRARITPTAEDARELLADMEREGTLVGRDTTPEHGGKTTRVYTKKAA